jgi:hypothetical protein
MQMSTEELLAEIEKQVRDLATRRSQAVDQLLDIAKIAHDDSMRDELEDLASRISLPPGEPQ